VVWRLPVVCDGFSWVMRVLRRRSRWNERIEMCIVCSVVVGAMLSCLQRILDGRAASTFQQPALSPKQVRVSYVTASQLGVQCAL
jgi:uncharacterized protein (DUF2062 family)